MIDIRNHGIGNRSGKMNIFCQTTEPLLKEGIWIQSNNEENINSILIDETPYLPNDWVKGESFMSMPTLREDVVAILVNSKIYCIGGYNGSDGWSNKVEIYDINLNTWSVGANIPVGRNIFGCCAVNNKIYCIGGMERSSGIYTNSLYIYDVVTNTWSTGSNMPTARYGLSSVVFNNKIYCFGGYGNTTYQPMMGTYLPLIEIYDIATNTWSTGSSVPEMFHSAGCVINGTKVYIIGGSRSNSTYCNHVNIYDIATNTWSIGSNMPTARYAFGCSSVGNKIYCFGGDLSKIYDTVEIYDIDTNTWSTSTKMVKMIRGMGCTNAANRIYCIGGRSDTGYLSDVYVYSLISKQYNEGTVVIERHDNYFGKYQTQFTKFKNVLGKFNSFLSVFDNAWFFKSSKLQEYPSYYGDGSKWIKFKN